MTADKDMNDMNQMEEALKRALSREEVPEGFAERVLVRASQQEPVFIVPRDPWWRVFSKPLVRWAAIAATAASLVMGGVHYRSVQRERAKGEAAKQQLMLALRIAGSKLQLAKARVNEINAPQPASRSRNEEEVKE